MGKKLLARLPRIPEVPGSILSSAILTGVFRGFPQSLDFFVVFPSPSKQMPVLVLSVRRQSLPSNPF